MGTVFFLCSTDPSCIGSTWEGDGVLVDGRPESLPRRRL